MTLLGMQLHLEEFDELFIKHCKDAGMTLEECRRELLDNQHRKFLVDSIAQSEALFSRLISIKIENDCIFNGQSLKAGTVVHFNS
jgi:hypothetical protein